MRRRGVRYAPWLLALPAIGLLIAFHFVPVGFGSYYAFTNWNGISHARWIGLQNFREIFHDPGARGALWHTLELTICFVVAVNALGLTLALGLNRTVKTRHFLRTLFFAPVVLSSLATAYIWGWIFDYPGAAKTSAAELSRPRLKPPGPAVPAAAPRSADQTKKAGAGPTGDGLESRDAGPSGGRPSRRSGLACGHAGRSRRNEQTRLLADLAGRESSRDLFDHSFPVSRARALHRPNRVRERDPARI